MEVQFIFLLSNMLVNKLINNNINATEYSNLCGLISEILVNSHQTLIIKNIQEMYDVINIFNDYDSLKSELNFIKTVNSFSNEIIKIENYNMNYNFYQNYYLNYY